MTSWFCSIFLAVFRHLLPELLRFRIVDQAPFPSPEQDDLLRPKLVEMIDPRHELVKLAAQIDREFFERE
ncbi:hypothetical protein [Paracoccus alcaliphilus]|uniref:hypothetical protein n=1 Tax=Paracoccus alcaliphilus TaxID=34002 RepID=UPI001113B5EF|nr:hypothetical protein [Paracoccus alcaliphilus]WCR18097.1 hypothetical protein JHW40_17710 [Paracoccus alcaliphilus]